MIASAPKSRRQQITALIACSAAIGACLALAAPQWNEATRVFLGAHTYWGRYDFRSFYAAGWLVAHGDPGDMYVRERLTSVAPGADDFLNPPFFALVVSPLAHASFERAYQLWTLLCAALLIVNTALLWRIARPAGRVAQTLCIAGFVTLTPVVHGLVLGQFSLLLAASWAACYLLLRRGSDAWAGVALAPMLIKPELALVAAVAIGSSRPRILLTLAPAALMAVLASVAMIGIGGAAHYASVLGRESGHQATTWMFGWNGVLGTLIPGMEDAVVRTIAIVLSTAAVAFAALYWRRGSDDLPRAWFVLTACMMLSDPHLFVQDVVLLAPAGVALLAAAPRQQYPVVASWLAVVWLCLWPDAARTIPVNVLFASMLCCATIYLTVRWHTPADGSSIELPRAA